ncbi:hypothetical protein MY11210_007928 [Beauveria gryllotalpidicola]
MAGSLPRYHWQLRIGIPTVNYEVLVIGSSAERLMAKRVDSLTGKGQLLQWRLATRQLRGGPIVSSINGSIRSFSP